MFLVRSSWSDSISAASAAARSPALMATRCRRRKAIIAVVARPSCATLLERAPPLGPGQAKESRGRRGGPGRGAHRRRDRSGDSPALLAVDRRHPLPPRDQPAARQRLHRRRPSGRADRPAATGSGALPVGGDGGPDREGLRGDPARRRPRQRPDGGPGPGGGRDQPSSSVDRWPERSRGAAARAEHRCRRCAAGVPLVWEGLVQPRAPPGGAGNLCQPDPRAPAARRSRSWAFRPASCCYVEARP